MARATERSVLLATIVMVSMLAAPAAAAQFKLGDQMRIVLLVDSSSAIAPMLTPFRAGLNSFLDALPGEPEVVMISTGGQLKIRVGPTSDRLKLHAAANGFASDGGGNSFLETLIEADERFLKSRPDRRSVFVILTTDDGANYGDARTDNYNRFMHEFVARGGRAHAIIVRGNNTGVTTAIAENLAQNTGGFNETVVVANALPQLMKTLAAYVAADQ